MIPIHEKKKNIQFLKAFASHIPCFEINEDLARAELERDDDAAYLAALPSARADAKRKAILSQVQLMDVVIRQLFLIVIVVVSFFLLFSGFGSFHRNLQRQYDVISSVKTASSVEFAEENDGLYPNTCV